MDTGDFAFKGEKAFIKNQPKKFSIYNLDIESFKNELTSQAKGVNKIISLPGYNDKLNNYIVIEHSNFTEPLHPKFGFIKSYSIQGISDKTENGKITIGSDGVHITIFSGNHPTFYVDPYSKDKTLYMSYNRSNIEKNDDNFTCYVKETVEAKKTEINTSVQRTADDGFLRTYRLALISTGEYSQFHINQQGVSGGTETAQRAAVLSAMNTTMARVNGLFERDLAVHMNIVLQGGDNPLIFLDPDTDNLTNNSAGSLIGECQSTCNNVIGSANYDIGHAFSTGAGGLAGLGVVCFGSKGQGVTGTSNPIGDPYNVDYVAHEMGHQFGAPHTFNNSCDGNRSNSNAVEPGSGSTIMAYAGICPPDVQSNSDDHFHAFSITSMWNHIQGTLCGTTTATGNNAPVANAGADFSVPRGTPLILKGNATDADGTNGLTYTWEQIDTEIATMPPTNGNTGGPQFRSFPPSSSSDRYLPKIETVAGGSTFSTWEVIPQVAREMNFSLVVRDNNAGGGAADRDDMKVTVTSASPFTVSNPSNTNWTGETSQTITWDRSTTHQSPINCQNVRIKLSIDGGLTFPTTLIESTPNDGSQSVTIPNHPTTTARIMVEAADNIFYNMNSVNFNIIDNPTASVYDFDFNNFSVYPNPSNGNFNITFEVIDTQEVKIKLFDIRGRMIEQKEFTNTPNTFSEELSFNGINTGLYILQVQNGDKRTTKKLLIK